MSVIADFFSLLDCLLEASCRFRSEWFDIEGVRNFDLQTCENPMNSCVFEDGGRNCYKFLWCLKIMVGNHVNSYGAWR